MHLAVARKQSHTHKSEMLLDVNLNSVYTTSQRKMLTQIAKALPSGLERRHQASEKGSANNSPLEANVSLYRQIHFPCPLSLFPLCVNAITSLGVIFISVIWVKLFSFLQN